QWRAMFSEIIPGVELQEYRLFETGDSVVVTFTLSAPNVVQKAGHLMFLRPDIFHPPAPPRLSAQERHHPVWFGEPREVISEVEWILPPDYTVEVDTPHFQSNCGAASISFTLSIRDTILHFQTIYRQNGALIWPEDYQSALRFTRDESYVRGQTILLKRN
ncbi:MAG: hypothetical protein D6732_29740, partial [Methanobacteriota archaeon]